MLQDKRLEYIKELPWYERMHGFWMLMIIIGSYGTFLLYLIFTKNKSQSFLHGLADYSQYYFARFKIIDEKIKEEKEKEKEKERLGKLPKCLKCNEPLDEKNKTFKIEVVSTSKKEFVTKQKYEFYNPLVKTITLYKISCHKCNDSFTEEQVKENIDQNTQIAKCPKCEKFNTTYENKKIDERFTEHNKNKPMVPNKQFKNNKNPLIWNQITLCYCNNCKHKWQSKYIAEKSKILDEISYKNLK